MFALRLDFWPWACDFNTRDPVPGPREAGDIVVCASFCNYSVARVGELCLWRYKIKNSAKFSSLIFKELKYETVFSVTLTHKTNQRLCWNQAITVDLRLEMLNVKWRKFL